MAYLFKKFLLAAYREWIPRGKNGSREIRGGRKPKEFADIWVPRNEADTGFSFYMLRVSPDRGPGNPTEGPEDLQTPFSWWLKVKVWFSSCLLSLHLVTHFPTIWPFLALEK